QGDALSDLLKVALFTSIATVMISICLWTAFVRPNLSPEQRRFAGGLAGLITALCVVPLPFFGWAMKAGLVDLIANDNISISALLELTLSALGHGLSAFIQFTKASLGAAILSAALGYSVARHFTVTGAGSRQTA
ncbi:MAG: hypothetical protein AAGJ85_09685, partial [Pseudomonadota bacterium]